jgi:hypothetical protein
VIDGASARLIPAALADALGRRSPAVLAAETARASLLQQLNQDCRLDLSQALLKANQALAEQVAALVGGFDEAHLLSLMGEPPGADPRRARLALPACVATAARLDLQANRLEFAHAGDTSLIEVLRSGETLRHTRDQMGPFDQAMLRQAAAARQAAGLEHLRQAIRLPQVREIDLENGLRHNYQDEQGRTHPGQGCGVLDGLPALADYLETGILEIDPQRTLGYCLLSDGLELLAPLDETPAQAAARLRRSGEILARDGLGGLYKAMRRMAAGDPDFDEYPRAKAQDDATGVWMIVEPR